MPRYRVLCSAAQLRRLVPEAAVERTYPAFIVVSAPEAAMARVRERYPAEELRAAPPSPSAQAAMASEPEPAKPRGGRRDMVVSFCAPVRRAWLKKVEACGVRLLGTIDRAAVVAVVPNRAAIANLDALPEVESVRPYFPEVYLSGTFRDWMIQDANSRQLPATRAGEYSRIGKPLPGAVVADFFDPDDCRRARTALRRQGISVVARAGPNRLVVNLLAIDRPADALESIRRRPGLRRIEEKTVNKLFNDVARRVMGGLVVELPPAGLGLTGLGEVVGVVDTGLDTGDLATLHPDLRSRVQFLRSYPLPPSLAGWVKNTSFDDGPADEHSGHGTHVAGSIVGDGSVSKARGLAPIRGMAPEALLVFQAVEQVADWTQLGKVEYLKLTGTSPPQIDLWGVPDHLAELFQEAYDQGARIYSLSWGRGEPGGYAPESHDVDQFVREHKDMLMLVAAGNEGVPAAAGFIEATSIANPGTAKNCLTVGACEHERPHDFALTYGDWDDRFGAPPFQTDSMTDSADQVAAFSSRGPCLTGRRKPDVIAPGTSVLSTRSSRMDETVAPFFQQFAAAPDAYVHFHGTSTATPLVAGCAALVRQYLRGQGFSRPSAALLKAALIHSAVYHPNPSPHPSSTAWADNEQGWGRVSLPDILAPPAPTRVWFIDATRGLETGQDRRYRLRGVTPQSPLRVTLVYTDSPGPQLVNNLNLLVEAPNGSYVWGNDFQGVGAPDAFNNVEGVIVPSPLAGVWRIRVVAEGVKVGRQDYALVVSAGATNFRECS
jgi:subtilisin family serine protease